ncbi:MAG TPA: hypothetical protein VFS43_18645 [Polyangiaceae bacterium]|nr:hypothetical protein [Polyangiaceae bacterium]
MTAPAACRPGGPHAFAPADEGPGRHCSRCGLEVPSALAGWYERGVEDGRADAWSRPPRPRAPRWAVAAALALGAALVGAAPTDALPAPPPHEALDGLGDCLAAAGQLEADLERAWGRTAGPDIAAASRAPVRTALEAASSARGGLAYALADARPCAASKVPGCAAYAAPLVSARRAELARATKALRQQVDLVRLSPEPPR